MGIKHSLFFSQDELKRCSVTKKLRLSAPWQNGPYKNKHIEPHKKNAEQQDVTDIQNKLLNVFVWLKISFSIRFLKMNSLRNVELPPCYG